MDDIEARLWDLAAAPGERQPLLTLGEARAVVQLLTLIASGSDAASVVAGDLASTLARRLPAEE